jgi:hypothetical protein
MALRDALEWARRLRTMITRASGPLTSAHLGAVESAGPADRLAKAADAWQEACAALLAAFSPQRRPELAAELDGYSGGYQLLEASAPATSPNLSLAKGVQHLRRYLTYADEAWPVTADRAA